MRDLQLILCTVCRLRPTTTLKTGGFEAADPVVTDEVLPVAQRLEAGPSPWAILPGSNSLH